MSLMWRRKIIISDGLRTFNSMLCVFYDIVVGVGVSAILGVVKKFFIYSRLVCYEYSHITTIQH